MDYIELEFQVSHKQPWHEILTSELAMEGFESFTENNDKLQAYIPAKEYNASGVQRIIEKFKNEVTLSYEEKLIPTQNWNAQWESDFKPVTVDNRLVIKAPFHKIEEDYDIEIEIQPQMSFGTGHHNTTWLLSKVLLAKNIKDKNVLDVGTGTGILAVLAKKLGAKSVLGTEIDQGSYENALENLKRNNCDEISVVLGDIDKVKSQEFGVIIANINKNVLKNHMSSYSNLAKKNSVLLLSGFFITDAEELIKHASAYNFKLEETYAKDEWCVLEFSKN